MKIPLLMVISITYRLIESLCPFIDLLIVIEPVLLDQRNDFIFHDTTHPFIIYLRFIFGCKIAVTDLEALAERAVLADSIIQLSDLSDNRVIQITMNFRSLISKYVLIFFFKSSLHGVEA